MMDSSRGADAPKRVVEETKRLYVNLLSKPLDSHQLARPSFKFIQEVAKSLITETRTLRNVFNSSDFETENKAWDKRRKCDFVQKLIDFVANHKQPVVGCVAAKLVAGLDPIKTNELLQALARIAEARLSGRDGNPKKPRTFTRHTPDPSSKQSEEKLRGEPKKTSLGKGTPTIIPKVKATRISSGVSTPRKLSTTGDRNSSIRELRTNNDGGSGAKRNRSSISSTDESPGVRPRRLSSVTGASDEKGSARLATETKEKDSGGRDESLTNQSRRDSAPKLSSASNNQPHSQYIIVSESEIAKNIQQLRTSLEQLRSNMLEIGQFESKLNADLVACLGNREVVKA